MRSELVRPILLISLVALLPPAAALAQAGVLKESKPVVVLTTSEGVIKLELEPEKAPITVKNFLTYVGGGYYDGTVFHRVMPNFMIQGGGLGPDLKKKKTRPSIKNEADNGLKNDRGTVAMARTNAPNSATSQFFINLSANASLNHGARGFGYAVFGHVIDGMDVVDKIAAVPTEQKGGRANVPVNSVVIESARRE